jgi:hypothetical protein
VGMNGSFMPLLTWALREPEVDDDLPAIEDMQPRVQKETAPVFVPPPTLDTEPVHTASAEESYGSHNTNKQSPLKPSVRHPRTTS